MTSNSPDQIASENTLATVAEISQVLSAIPQSTPFRFIERICQLSEQHIIAEYTFQSSEFYYAGHFPGNPITPGVILLEAMAQTGLVALGSFILLREQKIDKFTTLFTDCQAEFFQVVRPPGRVTIKANRVYWRRNKLKVNAELMHAGQLTARAQLSGVGVPL